MEINKDEKFYESNRAGRAFPDCECASCYDRHFRVDAAMRRDMREADREYKGMLD
jgi:hypothetical protein